MNAEPHAARPDPTPASATTAVSRSDPPRPPDPLDTIKGVTTLVYALQALSFLVGFTGIAGIIINYLRLADARGTWLESHFVWQIRTFWYQLLWGVLGLLTSVLLIGFVILAGVYCWSIYRVVKGWLNLADQRPMYAE